MKRVVILLAMLLFGGFLPSCLAQDKQKTDEKPKVEAPSTPIKVQVIFTEFEGDKKVKSLPYTLYINAPDSPELQPGWTKLRIGSRVPVYTVGEKGSMQYLDVGTNIDSRAAHTGGGHFLLKLDLERSWVEGDVLVPVQKPSEQDSHAGSFREPVIRAFRSEFDLKLRDGQTIETTMVSDPLSGKVLKVEVSVSVVK
jgi:hypothetical protein